MKTPTKLPVAETYRAVQTWLRKECTGSDGILVHRPCSKPIRIVVAYMSIHDWTDDTLCAGSGRVTTMPIPFCEVCEDVPETTGCMHLPVAQKPVGRPWLDCLIRIFRSPIRMSTD